MPPLYFGKKAALQKAGVLFVFSLTLGLPLLAQDDTSTWPGFRGPFGRGIGDDHSTPVTWDVETGAQIRWATEIPGLAHSSPIVWENRVFLTTAIRQDGDSQIKVGIYGSPNPLPDEGVHKFQVYCLDRRNGQVIWIRTPLEAEPDTQRHQKGSFAASTPVTDGQYLAAFFGSEGLYVYDLDGQLIWEKDFGVLDAGWYLAKKAQFGYAASPVLHDGKLIIQCDIQEGSFLCALDIKTGEELWRTPRDEVPTWSTPVVDVEDGRSQVIVNGYKQMGGYDLETGEELWKLSGGGDVPVPTPIVDKGVVYITNGHGRWNPIYAIKASAKGVIADGFSPDSEPDVLWSQRKNGTYMQTPILYRGYLFACKDEGVVTCINPETGEHLNRMRLGSGGDGFTASPVAADGKLYFPSESGEIYVISADPEMKTLAVNSMQEICMATPAVLNGELIIRTENRLVMIADGASNGSVAIANDQQPEEASEEDPQFAGASVVWMDSSKLPNAESVIESHLDTRGGRESLESILDVSMVGYWEMPSIGLRGDMKVWHKGSDRMISETSMPGSGVSRQGVSGKVAWIMNPSVGNTTIDGPIAEEMFEQAQYVRELSLTSRYDSLETKGLCTFEGQECFCIQGMNKSGNLDSYFFRTEDSLMIGRHGVQAGLMGMTTTVEVYGAYKEFGDVMIATETEMRFPDQDIQQVIHIDSVSFDTLEDTFFDVPKEVTKQ